MAPVDNLEKILLCAKYRCILSETGKPIGPKSAIYKEISLLLGGKVSPKYIYTILLQNRYGLHDKLLKYHNLDRPIDTEIDTSTSTDKSFNSSTDKDLQFDVNIPLKTWHDIDCESVIYKSNVKVQRNYKTLRRRKWTNTIFELIHKVAKLPCAFMFKRCRISESGIHATIYAKCPECKCNLIGQIITKPEGNTDVRMECRITNFKPDIKHTSKKRPLKGERRIEISQSLATGTLSATRWRRQEAEKIMNLYDPEPPHLYKASTLRKAKQERQDLNLQIKGSCAFTNLQNMKYTNHAGSIHCIGYDPFFIHYWTPEQITIYLEHHDEVYIDGTGSLVKKFALPNGELSSHIYLYQAVTKTQNYKMPIFQMLSTVQNANAIQYWLSEFLRIGSTRKTNFPIPRSIVCDFDMALLNAIAKAFGQYNNLKQYLTTCFALIVKEQTIEKPKCFIRLDICHYMNIVSKWKCLLQLNPKVKKFYIRAMALLTKQTDFSQFVELAKCILLLSLSEEIGKDNDGNDSPAEFARITITHHIKGIEDVSLDDEDDKSARNEEYDSEMQDCNIALWSYNLLRECREILAETVNSYDMANPYYAPQLSRTLKSFLTYFPLYSGIMIPIFGYGQINASSSAVESEMKDIKHILLKNMSRPMRADKFVTIHLRSFTGRSLLAMSANDSPPSAENNEKIIENKEITIAINNTNISPNINENNLIEDLPSAPIKKSRFQIEMDSDNSQTSITVEPHQASISVEPHSEEEENIIDNINDLNVEHNWRNKNTRQTKRKTYLDNCPEWDISNLGKTRIGVANLQNGNICSLISVNKKPIVVTNTCGFDSIACIIACACINESYKNIVESSGSTFMRFIKYFLEHGCCQNTYKLRAEILMNIDKFNFKIDKNIVTIDCNSSIGNVAQYIFQNDPSYTETKSCNVCPKIIIRQSALVPINVNILKEHGFVELSRAITEGMPNNKSICCNNQLMQRDIKFGTQIFIEYDPQEYGIQKEYHLTDFAPKIQFDKNTFILAGVIARCGSSRNGHYIAYSYQGSQWIEFDDLIKSTKYKTKHFAINPHLLIYITVTETAE